MEKTQIRKINIHASRIYFTMQRLKEFNRKKEDVSNDEKLKHILERGREFARNKKKMKGERL